MKRGFHFSLKETAGTVIKDVPVMNETEKEGSCGHHISAWLTVFTPPHSDSQANQYCKRVQTVFQPAPREECKPHYENENDGGRH